MAEDGFFELRVEGEVAKLRARLEEELKARKFGTLHVHDVKATLESKGVEFATPMVIMDVCNPGHAKRALELTANGIAPLLPCSVALWQDGAETVIRMLRPTMLATFFPSSPALAELARGVETEMLGAARSLVGAPCDNCG